MCQQSKAEGTKDTCKLFICVGVKISIMPTILKSDSATSLEYNSWFWRKSWSESPVNWSKSLFFYYNCIVVLLLSFQLVLKHMLSKKDPALLSWLSQFVVWLTNEKKSILIFRSRRHSRFHFADASLPPRVLFKLQRGSPAHLCWSDFGLCQLTCLTLSQDHIGGKGLIWSWRSDADCQLSQAFDGRRLSSWNAFNYSDQKYTQMFI